MHKEFKVVGSNLKLEMLMEQSVSYKDTKLQTEVRLAKTKWSIVFIENFSHSLFLNQKIITWYDIFMTYDTFYFTIIAFSVEMQCKVKLLWNCDKWCALWRDTIQLLKILPHFPKPFRLPVLQQKEKNNIALHFLTPLLIFMQFLKWLNWISRVWKRQQVKKNNNNPFMNIIL